MGYGAMCAPALSNLGIVYSRAGQGVKSHLGAWEGVEMMTQEILRLGGLEMLGADSLVGLGLNQREWQEITRAMRDAARIGEVLTRPLVDMQEAMRGVADQLLYAQKAIALAWGAVPQNYRAGPEIIITPRRRRYREIIDELKELPDNERMDALQELAAAEVERLPQERRIDFLAGLYRQVAPESEKLESGLSVVHFHHEIHHHHYHEGQPATVAQTGPGAGAQPTSKGDELLTEREREIAQLLARGKNQSEIAKELVMAEGTVKTHRQNIADKWSTTSGHKALQIEARRRGYGVA